MLSTVIIVFREIFEIAIILSVVLAATQGLAGRWKWVGAGIVGGILGAVLVAAFTEQIADAAEGMGQEFFNAVVLFIAAGVIGWTVIWMKRHAKALTAHIKKVGAAVVEGQVPFYSLSIVVLLAVLREGSEIVLLTYGLVASGKALSSIATGAIIGLMGGAVAGLLFYMGILKLSTKHLFTVTSVLLVMLAAGMAAQGAAFLVAADTLPALASPLWDSSTFLPQSSLLGEVLHALLGYSDQPYGMQVLVFAFVLGTLSFGLWLAGKGPQNPSNKAKA